MSISSSFCPKRTKIIVIGKKSQLRVPEGTHKGVMAICAKHGYSKASDAVIFLLNTALSVTGNLPEFDAIGIDKSQTGVRQ